MVIVGSVLGFEFRKDQLRMGRWSDARIQNGNSFRLQNWESMLALPPGPLAPCLLRPLLLPLARSPGGKVSALDLAGCPLLPATSGPPMPCRQPTSVAASGSARAEPR